MYPEWKVQSIKFYINSSGMEISQETYFTIIYLKEKNIIHNNIGRIKNVILLSIFIKTK